MTAISGLCLGFTLSIITVSAAGAATAYDRAGAVSYAKTFACNHNESCSNPNYKRMSVKIIGSADCTNFVSQAMYEGGNLPRIYSGSNLIQWFYSWNLSSNSYTGTNTWVRVGDLYNQLALTGRTANIYSPTLNSAYTVAKPGDLYMYDWGGGFEHLAMATSNGAFIDYLDFPSFKNYNSVTGGYGSKIAQHSTDRDGAPWNWGYWIEPDDQKRSTYHTIIIRIADSIN